MIEVIVGSCALDYFQISRRKPKDIDIWSTKPISRDVDSSIKPKYIMDLIESKDGYATPNSIYTIKCSHLGYDIHWQKTKLDILWLQSHGCHIIESLYNQLTTYWQKTIGAKDFLSLAKSKDEFFTDKVTYIYDHDYLHELVAYPDQPMYSKCLRDGHEVLIDKLKFDALSLQDQIRMFREEITVIACERWLFNPSHKGSTWFKAYGWALQKTIISLTKGWAESFIVLNLREFISPDFKYFKHILNELGKETMNGSELIEEMLVEFNKTDSIDTDEFLSEVIAESYSSDKFDGFEHILQEGGGEGGTEYCFCIFKWKDTIYKMEWSYYSHQGYEFDGAEDSIKEVSPEQKTITVYT